MDTTKKPKPSAFPLARLATPSVVYARLTVERRAASRDMSVFGELPTLRRRSSCYSLQRAATREPRGARPAASLTGAPLCPCRGEGHPRPSPPGGFLWRGTGFVCRIAHLFRSWSEAFLVVFFRRTRIRPVLCKGVMKRFGVYGFDGFSTS